MSASLLNKLLRHVNTHPSTSAELCQSFAAYRLSHVTESIARLLRLDLVEADAVGRLSCTPAGRVAAALPIPPRWSARRSQPRTATIAS